MIWKKIFPAQGGAIRRWVQIRKDLFELSSSSPTNSSGSGGPSPPLTLFDFSRRDDAYDAEVCSFADKGGWRISDDEVIGGYSRAECTLIDSPHGSLLSNESISDATLPIHNKNSSVTPYIRWKGNLDTRIGPKSHAKRSGFCAIKSPVFPFNGIPVGDKFNALEIKCRPDSRSYCFNLKVNTYFPDDLFQTVIHVESKSELPSAPSSTDQEKPFQKIILPFQDFYLTANGRLRQHQRILEGAIELQHLGLTLMDGIDGPFQFDLARIRLVNYSFSQGIVANDTIKK